MPKLPALIQLIDSVIEIKGMPRHPDDGPRRHLGASVIGKECLREIWYGWRWAAFTRFEGRMLRLFERGHDEEPRLAELLRIAGAEVQEYDPASIDLLWYHPESECYFTTPSNDVPIDIYSTCNEVTHSPDHIAQAAANGVHLRKPKQFRFIGYKGHFGGGCDGLATGVPCLEPFGLSLKSRLLCEFKTHSYDRYKDVSVNNIKIGKPTHWAQTVIYMDELKTDGALYIPVCKDDDEILPELLLPDPGAANTIRGKAQYIIDHRGIPPRMAHASPSNFKCKFCDFRRHCHYGAPLEKNCRTCKAAQPVDGGRWKCNKFNALIPEDKEIEGCPQHEVIEG